MKMFFWKQEKKKNQSNYPKKKRRNNGHDDQHAGEWSFNILTCFTLQRNSETIEATKPKNPICHNKWRDKMALIIQFATDGKLLAWSNSIVYSRLSSAKKDLEVTVNARVNTSQEPAAAAEGWTLGYVTRSADITGGTCYSPFIWHCWGCVWNMASTFGIPGQNRCWGTKEDPAESNQGGQATASDLRKEAEVVGLAPSCRKEANGWSNSSLQLLEGKL